MKNRERSKTESFVTDTVTTVFQGLQLSSDKFSQESSKYILVF